MTLDSHCYNTRRKFWSCCSVFSANMRLSSAVLVVPGISARIVWRACCKSSAAEIRQE